MDDRPSKDKFAIARGPVNRRTAAPAQRAERPPSIVLARLKARYTQHHLGTPLVQRLAADAPQAGGRAATSTALVLQAVGGTLGATAV